MCKSLCRVSWPWGPSVEPVNFRGSLSLIAAPWGTSASGFPLQDPLVIRPPLGLGGPSRVPPSLGLSRTLFGGLSQFWSPFFRASGPGGGVHLSWILWAKTPKRSLILPGLHDSSAWHKPFPAGLPRALRSWAVGWGRTLIGGGGVRGWLQGARGLRRGKGVWSWPRFLR